MIYGEDGKQLQLQVIGELLGIARIVKPKEVLEDIELEVESRVPNRTAVFPAEKSVRIQIFCTLKTSFFARPTPLIFYSSLDWSKSQIEDGSYRGPPRQTPSKKGAD